MLPVHALSEPSMEPDHLRDPAARRGPRAYALTLAGGVELLQGQAARTARRSACLTAPTAQAMMQGAPGPVVEGFVVNENYSSIFKKMDGAKTMEEFNSKMPAWWWADYEGKDCKDYTYAKIADKPYRETGLDLPPEGRRMQDPSLVVADTEYKGVMYAILPYTMNTLKKVFGPLKSAPVIRDFVDGLLYGTVGVCVCLMGSSKKYNTERAILRSAGHPLQVAKALYQYVSTDPSFEVMQEKGLTDRVWEGVQMSAKGTPCGCMCPVPKQSMDGATKPEVSFRGMVVSSGMCGMTPIAMTITIQDVEDEDTDALDTAILTIQATSLAPPQELSKAIGKFVDGPLKVGLAVHLLDIAAATFDFGSGMKPFTTEQLDTVVKPIKYVADDEKPMEAPAESAPVVEDAEAPPPPGAVN